MCVIVLRGESCISFRRCFGMHVVWQGQIYGVSLVRSSLAPQTSPTMEVQLCVFCLCTRGCLNCSRFRRRRGSGIRFVWEFCCVRPRNAPLTRLSRVKHPSVTGLGRVKPLFGPLKFNENRWEIMICYMKNNKIILNVEGF